MPRGNNNNPTILFSTTVMSLPHCGHGLTTAGGKILYRTRHRGQYPLSSADPHSGQYMHSFLLPSIKAFPVSHFLLCPVSPLCHG